jgi:hypothetical protein
MTCGAFKICDVMQSRPLTDRARSHLGLCVGPFRTLCGASSDFLPPEVPSGIANPGSKDLGSLRVHCNSSPSVSIHPIHPHMAARQTAPDLLSEDEKAILGISVRLDCALRHLEEHREDIDAEKFIGHVNDELVRCP